MVRYLKAAGRQWRIQSQKREWTLYYYDTFRLPGIGGAIKDDPIKNTTIPVAMSDTTSASVKVSLLDSGTVVILVLPL